MAGMMITYLILLYLVYFTQTPHSSHKNEGSKHETLASFFSPAKLFRAFFLQQSYLEFETIMESIHVEQEEH